MQRITISIDEALAADLDRLIAQQNYESRSEALRDITRAAVERWRQDSDPAEFSVASLSYMFDRRVRSLADRLASLEHAHHDLIASSTIVRLDHDHSLVTVVLKGKTVAIRKFANRVAAQRGVTFAEFNPVGVTRNDHHEDPAMHHHHDHSHLAPLTV